VTAETRFLPAAIHYAAAGRLAAVTKRIAFTAVRVVP
jgi:hypothetical protein